MHCKRRERVSSYMQLDWAIVTAEDLGERIQSLAIAMAVLVGVEEVHRGEEP